jgi:hypothetical protein
LGGSYKLPDDGDSTPKHVGAFDQASKWSDYFDAFVGFLWRYLTDILYIADILYIEDVVSNENPFIEFVLIFHKNFNFFQCYDKRYTENNFNEDTPFSVTKIDNAGKYLRCNGREQK